MSTVNQRRDVLPGKRELVSNGEIGLVVGQAKFRKWHGKTPERLDVEFRTQQGRTFVYWPRGFGDDGTEVLDQGQPTDLRAYASPKYSEVARRYTNLFQAPNMIADADGGFLERRLIHRTVRGELVRSISEVVVADVLHAEDIDYHYEKALLGADGVERYPDFTAEVPRDRHHGLLGATGHAVQPRLRASLGEEARLVQGHGDGANGPENDKGERLVTSESRQDGAIDSAKIREQVREVFEL